MVGLALGLKVRHQYVINRFEVERRVSENHEKLPVEPGILSRLDNLLNQARDARELLLGRVVGHTERKRAAPLLAALEIPNPTPEKIRVGEHELFSGHGQDSGTLEADVLHRPRQFPDLDVITDREGPVEYNREGCEQVP